VQAATLQTLPLGQDHPAEWGYQIIRAHTNLPTVEDLPAPGGTARLSPGNDQEGTLMRRQSRFLLTFGALLGALLGGLAMPAAAIATPSQPPFTGHETDSAVGDVFSCQPGDLTVQTGTITTVFHENADSNGLFHFTGTVVPNGVTLTDAAGNWYTLSGATWFGGMSPDPSGNSQPIVSTETDHFVIHNASGGVYAKVQVVGHLSPNGHTFFLDNGLCETPAG